MGLVQAKQDELATRLATLVLPTGLDCARADAFARLMTMGLPGRRDEYWRYTDAATLNDATAAKSAVFDASDDSPVFGAIDRLKLVFVDGVFDEAASDAPELAGVRIERLAAAGPGHWTEAFYGTLEQAGQRPVARPLATLNTAYATDGVLIRVTGKAAKPVSLIYKHKSDSSDAIVHHCIEIQTGAELTLLEDGPVAARLNMVMEVDLGEGARFHHIRAQGRDHERRAITHIFARLAAKARFKSFTLTANGVLTRNEVVIDLKGDDAVAHVAGAAVGDGRFHHDDTVFVTHDALRCESRQVFKKVLKNGAVGVFQGKILVKPGAQKTDGYQISQALLLDGDSQFMAKPELEIYADDVKCSHGSTSGAIDETALFYLRSRGVPASQAQALLVLAFVAQSIEEIDDEAIAADIRSRLEGWLARHDR